MKNNRLFGGRKLSVLSSTAISACVGCGAIFVAVLAFAYVITKIDATDLMLSVMSTAALGIGAYAGGYVCGKRQRRNGLLSGVRSVHFSYHCYSQCTVFKSCRKLFRACKACAYPCVCRRRRSCRGKF